MGQDPTRVEVDGLFLEVDGLFLEVDGLFLEVRYQRRIAFIDHVGRLTDELEGDYPDGNVSPSEIALADEISGAQLIVAADRIWVARKAPIDETEALDTLETSLSAVEKYMGPLDVEYVGARQMLLYPFEDVGDATAAFRRSFFDYNREPYTALGDAPIEAQASVSFRVDDGACKLRATAIYRGAPEDEGAGAALMLDVDRNAKADLDVWNVRIRATGLLTDGRGRALDFLTQLKIASPGADTTGEQ